MSLKKVGQAKKDKGFKVFDLIVYGVIIIIIAALFIAVFATRDAGDLKGIRVSINNVAVFEYDFGTDCANILVDDGSVEITENGEKKLIVSITAGDGDYNVMTVDKIGKSVSVTDANCRGKECVYLPPIKDNSRMIFCAPHRLIIEPSGGVSDDGNIRL